MTVVQILVAAVEPSATDQLFAILDRATRWLVRIAFVVATLFATVAGLRRMFAGDDPQQMQAARQAFRSALVGYAIMVVAPMLVAIAKSILLGS